MVGDAANGMVPFLGQGMNCGFEDLCILNNLLDKHHVTNLVSAENEHFLFNALEEYTKVRHEDLIAISECSLRNYKEMRSDVAKLSYRFKKKAEKYLYWLFPGYVPLYTMISFSSIRYNEAARISQRQEIAVKVVMSFVLLFACLLLFVTLHPSFT